MNRPNLSGMRRVRTIQTLINAAVPSDRAQLSSRIARLEHERSRLSQERNMWTRKQVQADERLRDIQTQLDTMQALLSPQQAPAIPGARVPARPADQKRPASGKTYKTVALEY